MDASMAVDLVHEAESKNEQNVRNGIKSWRNPSRYLVDIALQRWRDNRLRSDNTSVVCVMLDGTSKQNNSGVFASMQQEQSNRTIYDYSTSEAYNLDYMDINSFANEDIERQNFNLLSSPDDQQQQSCLSPYQSFYSSGMGERNSSSSSYQLPPFSSERGYQSFSQSTSNYAESETTSAELTYHTSSNESAFVKGCCPNERFMLARINEPIHYHMSYEQHKEMYRNMAQQPLPPLHYAYRPVVISQHSMDDGSFSLPTPKTMERFNYLRPTVAEVEELHNATEEDEFFDTTDETEEMEWSDDDDDGEKAEEKKGEESEENAKNNDVQNEADTSGSKVTNEIIEMKDSNDQIQIFEITSSNIGINGKSKNKEKEKANEKNKENSETPLPKRKASKSPVKQGRFYETRQTNRKMRSGNVCPPSGVQKTITKDKHKRIARYVRKTIKTINDIKASTSAALKKLESLSLLKTASPSPSTSNKHRVAESSGSKHEKSSSSSTPTAATSTVAKILRSSQISAKKSSLKVNVIRNLRSNAILTEKSIQRKRNSRVK
jgi:hypothetical protein